MKEGNSFGLVIVQTDRLISAGYTQWLTKILMVHILTPVHSSYGQPVLVQLAGIGFLIFGVSELTTFIGGSMTGDTSSKEFTLYVLE